MEKNKWRLSDLKKNYGKMLISYVKTLMIEYGVNIKVAQQRLGHASISIRMDICSHITEKVDKEVAEKLDKGIFETLDIGIGLCLYQELLF